MPEVDTPCELWQGSVGSNGYGRLWVKNPSGSAKRGYHKSATRHTWEQANGPIPEGLVVRHRCDNPPCVRLDHLELGTQRDNMQDASRRGRTRGILQRTMTDEQVARVVELLAQIPPLRQWQIAEASGCSQPQVSRIKAGYRRDE